MSFRFKPSLLALVVICVTFTTISQVYLHKKHVVDIVDEEQISGFATMATLQEEPKESIPYPGKFTELWELVSKKHKEYQVRAKQPTLGHVNPSTTTSARSANKELAQLTNRQ